MNAVNVLLIMVDQMAARASHLYGGPCATPTLATLAERGTLFYRAYTPHPLCVPARIATWTGSWSHRTGTRTNEAVMPRACDHAFRVWREAGYRTALIGKNHCFDREADDSLFDVWCEIEHMGIPAGAPTKGMTWVRPEKAVTEAHRVRRAMPVTGGLVPHAVTDFPLTDYSTALVADQTVRFLERFGDRPFAAWVSIPDPHGPYEVPAAYARLFDPAAVELPPTPDDEFAAAPERNRVIAEILRWSADQLDGLRTVVAAYLAMVRFIDDQISVILAALDRLGLRENTVVAFCSDHGDFAGEHRMMGKGGVFYDCLTRVPLILSWPGLPRPGQVEGAPVSLIDLVPTVLALQGLRPLGNANGRLLPGATSAAPRAAVFAEYGCGEPAFTRAELKTRRLPLGHQALIATLREREYEGLRAMIVDGRWKYVHDSMGDLDELYDLEADPWELQNRALDPTERVRMAAMRASIDAWRPAP